MGRAPIPRLLVSFSVPAVVGMLAQGLYNAVDRVILGRALGPHGIAGTTVAFPWMLVLLAFGMLIGFGAAALVSIRLGQGRKAEAEQVLGNAAGLLVGASVVLTIAGLICLDPLLRLFGASDAVLPYAHDYLGIIAAATVFQVVGFGLNAVIRGEGNPRTAMFTLLIGVTLNALLASLFVFGFGWGMRGAAFATATSQAVSAGWVVSYFLRGKSLLRLRGHHLRPVAEVCRITLAIGSPMFAMQLAASMIMILLNNRLRLYGGDAAVSVMGIIYATMMLVLMPIFGLNQGAQPIIGYNYGAGQYARVRQALLTAVLIASGLTMLGFAAMTLFPARIVALFAGADSPLEALGVRAMRISVLAFPLVGLQIIAASYFQAVGKPGRSMILGVSRQVLLLLPAVLILPRFLGLDGLWAAFPAADLCSSLITAAWLAAELRHLRSRAAKVSTI